MLYALLGNKYYYDSLSIASCPWSATYLSPPFLPSKPKTRHEYSPNGQWSSIYQVKNRTYHIYHLLPCTLAMQANVNKGPNHVNVQASMMFVCGMKLAASWNQQLHVLMVCVYLNLFHGQ